MQGKYFLEVDECILYNWRKANDGNLEYLRKKVDRRWVKWREEDDKKAFDILFKNFIDVIGLPDDFMRYLANLEKMNKLNEKIIATGDRVLLNDRDYISLEIIEYEASQGKNKGDIIDNLLLLNKMGYNRTNERDITVLEYHKMIKNG